MKTESRRRFARFFGNNMALMFLVVLFIYNSIVTTNFFSMITIRNLINQSTSLILMGLGQTLIISAGCIDISMGSGFCWGAVVFGLMIQLTGNVAIALIVCIASAAVVGLINGVLVGHFKIQTMIVTMAMMYILRSVSKAVTKCAIVRFRNDWLNGFIVKKFFGVIPVQLFIVLIATIIILVIVKRSRLGVYFEACGDNLIAAKTAGIRTELYIIVVYVIGNSLAFLGGVYDAAVVSSVDPTSLGIGYEFVAIAAAVIGGTPIIGGRPNVLGTVFGVCILKLISMMIQMNNISSDWSYVITAVIIFAAIIVQNFRKIRGKA